MQAAEIDLDVQTHPSEGPNTSSCEFGANPFSESRDISYTNKKLKKSERSSLRAVIRELQVEGSVFGAVSLRFFAPVPSSRRYLSCDDCLEDRGNIIRIALCCVVYDSCAQWYTHIHMKSS